MKIKSIALLVTGAISISQANAQNYDLATNNSLPSNQINQRYFVTNSSNNTANVVVDNDFTVNSEGSFHLGFSGKTEQEEATTAIGDINMTVNGNMQVYNDTWIGKFDTKEFTKMKLHQDFPFDPLKTNIDLHVTGDINVELGADKERGGLMILAGNVMNTGPNTSGHAIVKVDGDTNIRSGGNHLAGTASATAKLITRTFNLTGGDIEVIGVSTVLQTTNTDENKSSVLVGKTGKMIIMRGATVDVSNGGTFDVVDHGILTSSKGDGFVKLISDGQLNIGKYASIESLNGSLSISDQTSKTSHLNIAGNIKFGAIKDTQQMNKISGDKVDVTTSAKFFASNDFIKQALTFTTYDANKVVLSGNHSLKIAGMQDGETRALISNIYGDFNFRLTNNELRFVNATNVTDLTDDEQAQAIAKQQLSRFYQQHGISSKNVAKGFAMNLVKVADKSVNNSRASTTVAADKSKAGALNWAVFNTIAKGETSIESGKMTPQFNQAFAGLYNNNRGLHLTEIALNGFNYTRGIIDERARQFYQTKNLAPYDDNLWIDLVHQYENTDSHHGIAGYKYSSNGFMLGYDKIITSDWMIGAAFSYSDGNYKDKSAVSNDSDIKNYQIQLYGSYKLPNNLFTTAYLGYAYGDNELKQHDGNYLAKEKFHSNTWNIGASLGYDWQLSDFFSLTPTLGLAYVYTENSAHNVKYNQINLLKYGKASNSAVLVPVDLKANYTLLEDSDNQLTFNAKAGYTFNLSSDEFEGDITVNGINGLTKMKAHVTDRNKNQFNLGTGMSFQHESFNVDLSYQYFGESKRDTHYLSLITKYNF